MLAEITMGLGSLKAAMDLAKGLNAASNQAAINEVKIALQQHILDAQGALSAAQQADFAASARIRDLEEQLVKREHWETESQRYELMAIDRGAFAYMPKAGMENGETSHWLCTNCFENGHKSLLQSRGQVASVPGGRGMQAKWACNACRGEVHVYYARNPLTPWSHEPSSEQG